MNNPFDELFADFKWYRKFRKGHWELWSMPDVIGVPLWFRGRFLPDKSPVLGISCIDIEEY